MKIKIPKDDKNIAILYHSSDLDGKSSCAIVLKKHPNATIFPVDYGIPLPDLSYFSKVIIVDFCIKPFTEMLKLAKTKDLIWIDHHADVVKEAEKLNFKCKGLRRIGQAGCELTWQYFFQESIPEAITLLGRYDVWDLEYNEKVVPFQYGMRARNNDPTDPIWSTLFANFYKVNEVISDICRVGERVKQYDQELCKFRTRATFDIEIGNLRAICMNTIDKGSSLFEFCYDPKKHDLMIRFCRMKEQWDFSFYTTKKEVDCIKIAKELLGQKAGGHKEASGGGLALNATEIHPVIKTIIGQL